MSAAAHGAIDPLRECGYWNRDLIIWRIEADVHEAVERSYLEKVDS